MMLYLCAQDAIDSRELLAQSNRLPLRDFAKHDLLFENVAEAGKRPSVDDNPLTFEHVGGRCNDAEIQAGDKMNRMGQGETSKTVRQVLTVR
jgi:hypothetical protein